MTETRPSWHETYMQMAIVMGRRSLCSRRKVGAIIVSSDNRISASCYNGPPPGYQYKIFGDQSCAEWCPRAQKITEDLDPLYADCPSTHAESNAIARSIYSETQGGTLYVTSAICMHCAKAVASAGIAHVVTLEEDPESVAHRAVDEVQTFLYRAKVKYSYISTGAFVI